MPWVKTDGRLGRYVPPDPATVEQLKLLHCLPRRSGLVLTRILRICTSLQMHLRSHTIAILPSRPLLPRHRLPDCWNRDFWLLPRLTDNRPLECRFTARLVAEPTRSRLPSSSL